MPALFRPVPFAVAAVLLTCLVLAGSAQATFPGENGEIAINSSSGAGGGVFVVAPDGSNYRLVVSHNGDGAWSPDGARIASTREESFGGLYVSNADGSGQTLLVPVTGAPNVLNVQREPAWSPDGSTIAYVQIEEQCPPRQACVDVNHGIRAVAPDGTGDRLLIDRPASDPSYSPDGTRIAWDVADGQPQTGIHVSNADGTGDTALTQESPNGDGRAWEPSWSPDGSRIAFSRQVAGET
jgi:Tol biopolymer transport system component